MRSSQIIHKSTRQAKKKNMLGLLLRKYLKDPTICLNRVLLTLSSSFPFMSFAFASIGVTTKLQLVILNLFNISNAYFFWCKIVLVEAFVNSIPKK